MKTLVGLQQGGLALIIACWVALTLISVARAGEPGSRAAESGFDIVVTPAVVDPALLPIADGVSEWIRLRLERGGLQTDGGRALRRYRADQYRAQLSAPVGAGDPSGSAIAGSWSSTPKLLEMIAKRGVPKALLVDLRRRGARIEADFRLYEVEAGRLLGGGVATASPRLLVYESEESLHYIYSQLQVADSPPKPAELRATGMDALSSVARALSFIDDLAYTRAWLELQGQKAPVAVATAARIRALVAQPTAPPAEVARLANAMGKPDEAWTRISEAAPEAYRSPEGRVPTLVAAGEVQLERKELGQARAYFVKALEVEPRNFDAHIGYARLMVADSRPGDARKLLARAAELDPDSALPLELTAELSKGDARVQAETYLQAANRQSRQLDVARAQKNYERASAAAPQAEARARQLSGDLHYEVGEHDQAIASYERVAQLKRESPRLLMSIAAAQQGADRLDESMATHRRLLDEFDSNHTGAMVALGTQYVDSGQAESAVSILDKAHKLDSDDPMTERGLARALDARGKEADRERALDLYKKSARVQQLDSRDIRAMASLQRRLGDPDGARKTLESALALRELDRGVQEDLVETMKLQGDHDGVTRFASRFSRSGLGDLAVTEVEFQAHMDETEAFVAGFDEVDDLVASFAKMSQGVKSVSLMGMREPGSIKERTLRFIHPYGSNQPMIISALQDAIARDYQLNHTPEIGERFAAEIENLYRFDDPQSQNVSLITDVNIALATDAVFVARLRSRPADVRAAAGSCWAAPHYVLEMRRLAGQQDHEVEILMNESCLAGGAKGEFGGWNTRAAALPGLFLVLFLYPLIQGWGRVVVNFTLPPKSRALFAVRISRRPGKVKDRSNKSQMMSSVVFQKQLNSLSFSERRLEGDQMIFRWVAARRGRYFLTVRGPLLDLETDNLIGEFLEERVIEVKRGKTLDVNFDLCAKEAAVTVDVKRAGVAVSQAHVALRGVANSNRYCRDGTGIIYLGIGDHVVVVASEDRICERHVQIREVAPVSMSFDLESECLFEECEAAVMPYLEGDFIGASEALRKAGHDRMAAEIKALRAGPPAGPANSQAAPMSETVVQMPSGAPPAAPAVQLSTEESAELGVLREQENDWNGAAEAYREAGDLVSAARCYEQVYDWANAIECYQDLGESERWITLLEKSGDLYQAGCLAEEMQQIDRAIHNLQQVDTRHSHYIETCNKLAELFIARGEARLAIEKFGEVISLSDAANLSCELLDRYAGLLEEAGRHEDALKVCETIRGRDLHYTGINTRIESIEQQISGGAVISPVADEVSEDARTRLAPSRSPVVETRYEILSELGRGGMGVVYKARDKHLQRVVALKVLSENLRQHQSALDLFLREARSAAALNHRNIVTVYDAGQEGEMDFISMEYLQGSGLDAVLKARGALNARLVASLGLQVAAGLDYAEQNKIIHRDIKPSNLFITRDKIVKIMDFGLAKMVEEVRRASTVIGGTPNYMSPEQAIGRPTDHRTDLYAFGGTLFHLVTGTVPFEDGDVTYHHAHTPPPDPREREVSVPAAMAELILRLMAKDPAERCQSAREAAGILQQILRSDG